MLRTRTVLMSLLAVSLLGVGSAWAQTQTPAAPLSVSAQAERTMTDVSRWTHRQWSAAKAKWRAEKDTWNVCQGQARAQNLAGRKSWQFLYDCMTKS